MSAYRLPSQFAAARRALAWAAVVISGMATLGLAWRAILLTVAVALGGCAVLPSQVERPASYARSDVADTGLAKIAAASAAAAAGPEVSGFRLLGDGAEAFDVRVALIRRAEKTLDIQYYVIASDATGREFLRELQAAAARGVRVRILVDDLYATGQDAAVRRPGRARQRRGPPVQPAAGARRRLRAAHRVLAAPVLAHQPPDAQQAVHRRRQLRRHRRPQHRRRVLRSQRRRQLHRHGPAVERPGGREAGRGVRRLLELRGRVSDRQPDRRHLPRGLRPPGRRRRRRRHPLAPGRRVGRFRAGRRPGRARARQRRGDRRRPAEGRRRHLLPDGRRRARRPAGFGPLRSADRLALLHPRRRDPRDPGRPACPRRRRLGADQLPGHHRRAAGALRLRRAIARPC